MEDTPRAQGAFFVLVPFGAPATTPDAPGQRAVLQTDDERLAAVAAALVGHVLADDESKRGKCVVGRGRPDEARLVMDVLELRGAYGDKLEKAARAALEAADSVQTSP